MLTKRIIPCLDVKDGKVIKGVRFREHKVVGDIVELAERYSDADELVFYDITASGESRTVDTNWVARVAKQINIPFCVAGGICTIEQAENILAAGADKISINTPALESPAFIDALAKRLGSQCIVIGIDSFQKGEDYTVYQYTGIKTKTQNTNRKTSDWVREVQDRGAGEIVLNCMNQDGVRNGYDIPQLKIILENIKVPLVASGGAGNQQDFLKVFEKTNVSGALAATVFHKKLLSISELKKFLQKNKIEVRI